MSNVKQFLDTSAILELASTIDLSNCVISSVSLKELENIKTSSSKDSETKYKARRAIREIIKQQPITSLVDQKCYDTIREVEMDVTPDSLIIASAHLYQKTTNEPVELLTNDFLMKLLCESYTAISCRMITSMQKEIYKGYREFTGTTEEVSNYLLNLDLGSLNVNEYVIVNDTNIKKSSEYRYDGKELVALSLPSSSYIKGKNSLQRCVLDLLFNKDITTVAILGLAGSGKSYLAMQMAKYHVLDKKNQDKILGIREALGNGKEVGYLKGTFEDKTKMFFLPLKQQLDTKVYDFMLQTGALETNIPFYLKGTSYSNTIMLVDEAEDLSASQLKLIGTRAAENTRIFFSGDYKQSEINTTLDNPLVRMCEEFKGKKKFGCIVLNEDVRSETSKMFANLFEK